MEENVFTRKIGPLPGYAWAGGAIAVIAVAQRMYANKASTQGVQQGPTVSGQAGTIPQGYVNYYPAAFGGHGGNGDTALWSIQSLLSVLAAQGAAGPTPGNTDSPAVSPGNTGNAGLQPQLVPVKSSDFSKTAAPGVEMSLLGSISAPGQFSGYNIGGGAPQYAYLGNNWVQEFNWSTLPVGTQIATPESFQNYVSQQYVSGQKVA